MAVMIESVRSEKGCGLIKKCPVWLGRDAVGSWLFSTGMYTVLCTVSGDNENQSLASSARRVVEETCRFFVFKVTECAIWNLTHKRVDEFINLSFANCRMLGSAVRGHMAV